jgi:hypothetical protein
MAVMLLSLACLEKSHREGTGIAALYSMNYQIEMAVLRRA